MKERAVEVWEDLRDRRLWPVAVVLLLALVAVPVVLVKPAEESPSQAAAPVATANDPLAKQAVVKAFDAKPLVKISNLDQFASKDPFKPIEQLKPIEGTDQLVSSAGGAGDLGALTGGGSTGGTGGGTPDTSPGTTPGGGGDTGNGGGTTTPKPKKFTYVIDLTFGEVGDTTRYQSFGRLGMLPSQSSPLLVYLGVDATGTQAAFLVDSSLDASGEGTCKPSAESCGVVYLEGGEKETFNDGEGHSFELVIDQIRKVEVRSSGARAKAGGAAKKDDAATKDAASKSDEATQAPRRFLFPVLIDLETEGHS